MEPSDIQTGKTYLLRRKLAAPPEPVEVTHVRSADAGMGHDGEEAIRVKVSVRRRDGEVLVVFPRELRPA